MMLRNPSYDGHSRALSLADRRTMLSVGDCRTCGHAIAWARSKRTGKPYPCEVVSKVSMEYGRNGDVLRAAPWKFHKCPPRDQWAPSKLIEKDGE